MFLSITAVSSIRDKLSIENLAGANTLLFIGEFGLREFDFIKQETVRDWRLCHHEI